MYVAAALLKIAYLYVFRLFGYGALIPESMQSVRRQIEDPTKPVLPKSWVVKWPFLEDVPGVSLVFWPGGLRAYLVVFDLDSGRRRRRFGILLPEPDDVDLKVHGHLLAGMSSKAVLFTFQENIDLLKRRELCFYAHTVWGQAQSAANDALQDEMRVE